MYLQGRFCYPQWYGDRFYNDGTCYDVEPLETEAE
jgi:hypothetical protein